MTQQPYTFSLLPRIINGSIAAVMSLTCVFPLDTIKTRLQNQQIGPNGERRYKNIADAFVKIYRNEGYFSLYRGAFAIVLLVTPEKTTKWASNDYFRYKLTKADGTLPLWSQGLAGGLAGCLQSTISTPMELFKIQMQDAGRLAAIAREAGLHTKNINSKLVLKRITRERGMLGLWRGITPTALRDVTFAAVYFPIFSALSKLGPRRADGEAESWVSLLCGLTAGGFCALLVTPFDVVKTRLQVLKTGYGERKFNGVVDCFVSTYRHEGSRALYKGGLCRIAVLAPVYAIAQTVYYLGIGEWICGQQHFVVK